MFKLLCLPVPILPARNLSLGRKLPFKWQSAMPVIDGALPHQLCDFFARVSLLRQSAKQWGESAAGVSSPECHQNAGVHLHKWDHCVVRQLSGCQHPKHIILNCLSLLQHCLLRQNQDILGKSTHTHHCALGHQQQRHRPGFALSNARHHCGLCFFHSR